MNYIRVDRGTSASHQITFVYESWNRLRIGTRPAFDVGSTKLMEHVVAIRTEPHFGLSSIKRFKFVFTCKMEV